MAQGKIKVKASVPKGAKKSNKQQHQKKKEAKFMKKGKLTIAPKKKALLQNHNLKQQFSKSINSTIESNVLSAAKAKGTTLHMNKKLMQSDASGSK